MAEGEPRPIPDPSEASPEPRARRDSVSGIHVRKEYLLEGKTPVEASLRVPREVVDSMTDRERKKTERDLRRRIDDLEDPTRPPVIRREPPKEKEKSSFKKWEANMERTHPKKYSAGKTVGAGGLLVLDSLRHFIGTGIREAYLYLHEPFAAAENWGRKVLGMSEVKSERQIEEAKAEAQEKAVDKLAKKK